MSNLSKQQILDMIKLLSALESWLYSSGRVFPDYLSDQIAETMSMLSNELLNEVQVTFDELSLPNE